MTIRYIEGDLFKHEYDSSRCTIIAQVCNDQGRMGDGFVVPLAKTFPWVKEAYCNWFKDLAQRDSEVLLDTQRLGDFTKPARGQTQLVNVSDEPKIIVANMVAQDLSDGPRPLYYNDLVKCMEQVANCRQIQAGAEIICPMFGSGLAGGNWDFIQDLITDCWLTRGIQVTVYYLKQFLPEGFVPPAEMFGRTK